ncbi:unnamed protein product, partial [Sphacelaria rigidula]
SIKKFDGTNFLEWKRGTRALISLTHPGISDIMNGGTRPAEIFDNVEHIQGAQSIPVPRSRSRSTPPFTRSQATAPSSSGEAADSSDPVQDPLGDSGVDFPR